MTQKWRLLPLALLCLAVSCSKQEKETQQPTVMETQAFNDAEATTTFAKILARAMTNKEVRELIKQEALKKFDKDYDVLYQYSRTATSPDGHTLEELLAGYAESPADLKKIADQLLLSTIYVPELENFNPQHWNTDQQIPVVAVRNTMDKKLKKQMLAYDANGTTTYLSYTDEPTYPIIVLKENERVAVASGNDAARKVGDQNTILRDNGRDFYFIDEVYNGLKPEPPASAGRLSFAIDQKAIYARNQVITPVRDYIYYDIDPSTGVNQGPLNTNYAEFLMAIAPTSAAVKNTFVDFGEGDLEFQIDVFFIGNEGGISSIEKKFVAKVTDLFPGGDAIGYADLTARPLEIANWDLKKWGDTWKVAFHEIDPGTEYTYTTSVSSTFGYNFELNVPTGKEVKVGLKFGISGSTTKSSTATVKITNTSDDLATALYDYSAPVEVVNPYAPVRPGMPPQYMYNKITTGLIDIWLTPRKRF